MYLFLSLILVKDNCIMRAYLSKWHNEHNKTKMPVGACGLIIYMYKLLLKIRTYFQVWYWSRINETPTDLHAWSYLHDIQTKVLLLRLGLSVIVNMMVNNTDVNNTGHLVTGLVYDLHVVSSCMTASCH